MITQVELLTPRVTTSPLPFTDGKVATDFLQIRDISGLGPVDAVINTTQYGSIDGEFYNGSTTGKRNIVMRIGLNPDYGTYTYEDLRLMLYSYIMPKKQITLIFESTHMETVTIGGYVEKAEPNIFSKDPEMAVSIICPKGEFVALSATVIPGVTQALPDGTPVVINYQGNVDTGFVLDIAPTTGVGDLNGEIRMINEGPVFELFIMNGKVDATTYVEISTVEGNKYAQQVPLPSGAPTNALGSVSAGSVWMSLKEGLNNFRVMSASPGQTWSLSYYARYGGL